MSVGRICSRVVETARPEETVSEAAQRMREQNVGSLLVQDDDGRLVGIVTDRDLTVLVLAEGRSGRETTVAEVMSEVLQTVREDASLGTALAAMRRRRARRLPVVDAEDRLVGVLALDDVVALLAEELGAIRDVLEAESPRRVLGTWIPDEPEPDRAPLHRRPPSPPNAASHVDLSTVEHTLGEVRDALEVVACALAIGLPVRLVGGNVIEGDVRALADRRLRAIVDRLASAAGK